MVEKRFARRCRTLARSSGCSSLAIARARDRLRPFESSPPIVTTMTPGSCSVMNCPIDVGIVAAASSALRDDAGLFAKEIVGDEVERGRRLLVGDRRPDPRQSRCPSTGAVGVVDAAGGRERRIERRDPSRPVRCRRSRRRSLDASTLPVSVSTALLERNARLAKVADAGRSRCASSSRSSRAAADSAPGRREKICAKSKSCSVRSARIALLHGEHGGIALRGLHRRVVDCRREIGGASSPRRRAAPPRPERRRRCRRYRDRR